MYIFIMFQFKGFKKEGARRYVLARHRCSVKSFVVSREKSFIRVRVYLSSLLIHPGYTVSMVLIQLAASLDIFTGLNTRL